MKLYYLFLQFILPPLNEFNICFQSDESMIGYLHAEMNRLLRLFLGKFVSQTVLKEAEDLTTVDLKTPENKLQDDIITVGLKTTRPFIRNNEFPAEKLTSFYQHVRLFYIAITDKLLKKFFFKDMTLKTLSFVDPQNRNNINPKDVAELADRFSLGEEADALTDQYLDYKLFPMTNLAYNSVEETRFETFWLSMEKKTLPTREPRFNRLCKVALCVLSLPHSNVDAELSFSMQRLTLTGSRLPEAPIFSVGKPKAQSQGFRWDP